MYESRKPNARVGRQIPEAGQVNEAGAKNEHSETIDGNERRIGFGRALRSVGVSLVVLVGIGVAMNHWMAPGRSNGDVPAGSIVDARRTDSRASTVAGGIEFEATDPDVDVLGIAAVADSSEGAHAADAASIDVGAGITDAASIADVADVARAILASANPSASSPAGTETTDRVDVTTTVDYDAAERLYREGTYSEAASLFAAYAVAYPQNPWGHYMEALSLWKSGDAAAAEVTFLRALDCDRDHLKSLVNLTRVRLERGEYEDARLPIERALGLAPQSAQVHRVLGRVEHNLGNAGAAEASYLQTLRILPTDVWSLNNLGLLRIEAGRYEEALAPLALARELDDRNAIVQNNLGAALERSGDLQGAEAAYLSAAAIDPGHVRAQISRERVAARMDQQSRPTVDLAALARRFEEEIAASDTYVASADPSWGFTVMAEETPVASEATEGADVPLVAVR